MKGLLLRVGIDKGTGGCLAPLFEDGTFEFIPIPETRITSENRVYVNIRGKSGKMLGDFLPKKIKYSHPHFDPEFKSYTYGDPTRTKRNQLSKLNPGDLLIFYAGLIPLHRKVNPRLYVIGYFKVEKVYDFQKITQTNYTLAFKKVKNNAHAKYFFKMKEMNLEFPENNLIIIKGNSKNSKLLKKAILIGDSKGNLLKKLEPIFGYKGSLVWAVGHWIEEEYILRVKNLLNK
jgi:hypothetical protein